MLHQALRDLYYDQLGEHNNVLKRKIQVLRNLQTYLVEEELKMMKADAECKYSYSYMYLCVIVAIKVSRIELHVPSIFTLITLIVVLFILFFSLIQGRKTRKKRT